MIETAVLIIGIFVVRGPLCRFGDWFCAERGAGEGRNGWV